MAGWGIVSNDINIMFVQTRRPCFKEQRPTILRPVRMEEKLLTFPTISFPPLLSNTSQLDD